MVSETELTALRELAGSERDPEGYSFATLAEALRRAGRVGEAREVATRGVERLPGFASGHIAAARASVASGDPESARTSFQQAIALDPDNQAALLEGGEVALSLGDTTEAQLYFDRLRSGGLGDPEAVQALGSRLVDAQSSQLARAAETEAAEPPAAPPLSQNAEMDDLASAIHGVTSTSVDEDAAPESLLTRTLAELLVAQGLHTQAVEAFEQLVARDPENQDLRQRLVEVSQLASAGLSETSAEVMEVSALAPSAEPVDALAPDARPVGDLAPDAAVEEHSETGPAATERADARPVADFAPETTPVEDLAPRRTDRRLDEEFRRWLQGLDG